MSTTFINFKKGRIYKIPLEDIEYIGYFPSKNLSIKKGELASSAYSRLKYNDRSPDFIMNVELFNMKTYAPSSAITDEGEVHLATETFGYSFVNHKTPILSYKNNINAPDFVGAYPLLVKDGKKFFTSDPAGLGGSRARTAVALNDKYFGVAIIPEPQGATLTELANQFITMGFTSACNFDGGGSTQGTAMDYTVKSTRPVRGFLAIWVKQDMQFDTTEIDTSQKTSSYKGIVTASALNVRSGNSTGYKILSLLKRNATVTIIEESNGWGKLSTGGWVSLAYIKKI